MSQGTRDAVCSKEWRDVKNESRVMQYFCFRKEWLGVKPNVLAVMIELRDVNRNCVEDSGCSMKNEARVMEYLGFSEGMAWCETQYFGGNDRIA